MSTTTIFSLLFAFEVWKLAWHAFQEQLWGLHSCRKWWTWLVPVLLPRPVQVQRDRAWCSLWKEKGTWFKGPQHHRHPAGPLFDIKCLQQSCQFNLTCSEICSTSGYHFLSVACVRDDNIEFLTPRNFTETCVIINITGFPVVQQHQGQRLRAWPVWAL